MPQEGCRRHWRVVRYPPFVPPSLPTLLTNRTVPVAAQQSCSRTAAGAATTSWRASCGPNCCHRRTLTVPVAPAHPSRMPASHLPHWYSIARRVEQQHGGNISWQRGLRPCGAGGASGGPGYMAAALRRIRVRARLYQVHEAPEYLHRHECATQEDGHDAVVPGPPGGGAGRVVMGELPGDSIRRRE